MFKKLLVFLVIGLALAYVALIVSGEKGREWLRNVRLELPKQVAPPELRTGELEVKLDAAEYAVGETVVISVRNLLSEDILTHVGTRTPIATLDHAEQAMTDGSWLRHEVQCQYPHCRYVLDSATPLPPGQKRTFRWEPTFFPEGKVDKHVVTAGQYRLVIRYQVREAPGVESWEARFAATEPFLIK